MRSFTSCRRRLSLPVLLSLIGAGFFISGCAGSGSASQAADAPIKISHSQLAITVRNDSGVALNDVTVAVVPMARTTVFDKMVGRIEDSSTREIMLGDLMGRDGTPFNLRAIRPKAVQVKGTDANGKMHDVEVAW